MDEVVLARLIARELLKNGDQEFERSFRVKMRANEDEFFTPTIKRAKRGLGSESHVVEALTISALPPGSLCGFGGGSGKVR